MEETNVVKTKKFDEERGAYTVGGLVGCAVLLLLYFVGWSYIYNTDGGVEVGISGWNLIIAFMTNNYKGVGAGIGQISAPFYCYAQSLTVALSILAFVSFIFVLVIIGLSILNICLNNKRWLSKIIHILFYALAAIFIASIVVSLCMKHSRILRVYCSGKPACSMQT